MCKKVTIIFGAAVIGLICIYFKFSLPAMETFVFAFVLAAFPLLVCYAFGSERKHRRIGELAMQKNMLTEEEVVSIILSQKKCTSKFGEIAIREKYLSHFEVDSLLSEQSALIA